LPLDNKTLKTAEALHQHARGCKKPLGECKTCQRGVEWFGALPKNQLSEVLEDRSKLVWQVPKPYRTVEQEVA